MSDKIGNPEDRFLSERAEGKALDSENPSCV